MAMLEKACVKLDVAEIGSGSAVVVGSGVTWAEVSGGVVLVAGGCGETELLRLSNLILLRTTGAVILQTGKSPGFKLQLIFVAIREDSTSCRLDF